MNLSTVYQNLKEDWRKEGKQESKQEVAIVLLQEKMPMELIQKATGLTRQRLQTISDRLAAGETPESIMQN